MYGQIGKWFQNHTHLDQKACSETKKAVTKPNQNSDSSEDDSEAIQAHLKELQKGGHKKPADCEKASRLLSLMYKVCRREMMQKSAPTRVSETPKLYSVLSVPVFVSVSIGCHN